MKHIERHTYVLEYNKDKIEFFSLHAELKLLAKVWPNATIDGDTMGIVRISYEGFTACQKMAEDCALMFRNAVSRHSWWEEV